MRTAHHFLSEKARFAAITIALIASTVESTFLSYGIQTVIHRFSELKSLKSRLNDTEYDLLFLDIRIGETDGIEFTIKLNGEKKQLTLRSKMQILEEQLKEFGFLRVYSGYIVNMKYIRLIEPSHILPFFNRTIEGK